MRQFWKPWLLALAAVAVAGLSLLRAADSKVHDSSPELKKELSGVVESQLAAFRSADFEKAYGFAASEIQAQFSSDQFEAMVKASYPVIAKSSSAEFGATLDSEDEALIDVHVVSATERKDGQFRYRLHKEDGKWRITGVLELKPVGISV